MPASLSELFSASPPPCFSGDSFDPCSGDTLLKVNAKCVVLPLSLKKSVFYKVVCCSVLKVCPIPRKPRGSKYLQASCLSAQYRVLTHPWMQNTTLKGGTQQTLKYRKYRHVLYCLHLCSIPPPAFGTAACATVLIEKYGKVLVLFYTYFPFPLFYLYA